MWNLGCMFEYLGKTLVIIANLVYEMFCQVWVIICSAHRNVMELGKLTWKTHTILRRDVITTGDCKSSVILKN